MKRVIVVIAAAVAFTATLALPAQADPAPGPVKWVCVLDTGVEVTFVTAGKPARFGIEQANSTAGEVFADQFGEDCRVE